MVDEKPIPIPVLVVYREMHVVGWTVPQIYAEMVRRSEGEEYHVTLIDPSSDIHKGNEAAGKSTYEQFISLGVRGLVKANNTVDAGLGEVRQRMAIHGKSPGLLIFLDCHHTWQECTEYRYKTHTVAVLQNRDPDEGPLKKRDHHPDNMRYVCQWDPLPKKSKKPPCPMRSFGWFVQRDADRRRLENLIGNGHFRGRIGQ